MSDNFKFNGQFPTLKLEVLIQCLTTSTYCLKTSTLKLEVVRQSLTTSSYCLTNFSYCLAYFLTSFKCLTTSNPQTGSC